MALLQSLSCSVCGKIFGSRQTLKRHRCQLGRTLPAVNAGLVSRSLHRCRNCGMEFATVRQLNEHAAEAHRDRPKKPYVCAECHKSFAHPYSLKRHRVEHGGDAHVCPTCGKRFAQLYELSRHLKSHHAITTVDYDPPLGLAFTATADNPKVDSVGPSSVSAPSLASEPANCLTVQIAKYMALQDAQTGLASHLMFHDGHMPKPGDVGILAFAQSLVVTSTAHSACHSVTSASAVTE